MAKYYTTTLQKGSKGDDTSEWQKFLNSQGYNLTIDGDFGDNTYNATVDWQTKNGLTADGIVGNQTWGRAGFTLSPSSQDWSYDDFEYDDFEYDDYEESGTVTKAGEALDTHLANKPGEYQSQWQTQLDDLMKQIMNRDKFSYDLNGDALYQQYKDKYTQQGKLAMMDTMGQAAAMNGGYGSSYAQSVGQQAYQASLDKLNDIVPDLYQMALDKYNQEGQDLYNQYGLVMDRENTDYGRYRDTVSDWNTERDYLAGRYDSERTYDYNQYVDGRDFAYDQYSSDRNLAYDEHATDKNLSYNQHRDAIEDEQWQKSYDLSRKQYEEAKASGSNQGLQHVGSMSSQEIVETMQSYSADGDDEGLNSFLADCVMTGRMTEEQADEYYKRYRTKKDDEEVDITVPPIVPGGGGGGGGRFVEIFHE